MKRILIVGAGFSGVSIARTLAENGIACDVIDQRPHFGGNAYDYDNELGIRIHAYGPHIFHTNNEKVVNWVKRFGEWSEYKHKVKAQLSDGRYVTLPVNRETTDIVGKENLLDTFFRPYTKKMWGLELEELDPKILDRIPIRDDDNEYYFPNARYQLMPVNGYTSVFHNILDHDNISVKLSTGFEKSMEKEYEYVFNCMPIDVYFEFKHGKLPYRSIKFNNINLPMTKILPVSVVNFTHSGKHTRMTEWKNFPNHGVSDSTTLTYEEPCDYEDNNDERYYPVKDINGENRKTYKRYLNEVDGQKMKFVGRCGNYAYIDMHQAVSSGISAAEQFIHNNT
jgi:UDP-galactopyranose mutase|tara:strand:- start:1279 stop:2292 length:1014 start_codon:yes stop_codon:yes gene_type:complete